MIVCVNYELLFIMNFFNFGFFSIYVQYEILSLFCFEYTCVV